jgi:hypothetical protein
MEHKQNQPNTSVNQSIKYIGQMGRAFHTRYNKHIQAIRNNSSKSGYCSNILNTGHGCGTVIYCGHHEDMGREIPKSIWKYHIYNMSKDNV